MLSEIEELRLLARLEAGLLADPRPDPNTVPAREQAEHYLAEIRKQARKFMARHGFLPHANGRRYWIVMESLADLVAGGLADPTTDRIYGRAAEAAMAYFEEIYEAWKTQQPSRE